MKAAVFHKPGDIRQEAEAQQKKLNFALAITATVVGGLWLVARRSSALPVSTNHKARYGYNAHKADKAVQNALESAGNSVRATYKKATSAVETALA